MSALHKSLVGGSAPAPRLLCAAAGLLVLGALVPLPTLRAGLALPIALLAPGYALVTALFGSRLHGERVMVLALSAMLSMAFYPLLTLALYAVSLPIDTLHILAGTVVAIGALAAVAARAGRHAPATAPAGHALAAQRPLPPAARTTGLFAASIAAAIAAVAGGLFIFPRPVAAPYTQFYLAGPWSHLDTIAYATPHRQLAVAVGLANQTQRRQTYRIAPLLDDGPSWHVRVVALPPGHAWTGTVAGYVPASGCIHRLSINLLAGRSRGVLSRLTLWVRGTPGTPPSCLAPARPFSRAAVPRVLAPASQTGEGRHWREEQL